jgi:hypothetical protein
VTMRGFCLHKRARYSPLWKHHSPTPLPFELLELIPVTLPVSVFVSHQSTSHNFMTWFCHREECQCYSVSVV